MKCLLSVLAQENIELFYKNYQYLTWGTDLLQRADIVRRLRNFAEHIENYLDQTTIDDNENSILFEDTALIEYAIDYADNAMLIKNITFLNQHEYIN